MRPLLSVVIFVSLSLSLFYTCLSLCVSISISASRFTSVAVCLSVCLSVCLYVFTSVRLHVCLSVCLCWLSVCFPLCIAPVSLPSLAFVVPARVVMFMTKTADTFFQQLPRCWGFVHFPPTPEGERAAMDAIQALNGTTVKDMKVGRFDAIICLSVFTADEGGRGEPGRKALLIPPHSIHPSRRVGAVFPVVKGWVSRSTYHSRVSWFLHSFRKTVLDLSLIHI